MEGIEGKDTATFDTATSQDSIYPLLLVTKEAQTEISY
jgi:hypothetical protein